MNRRIEGTCLAGGVGKDYSEKTVGGQSVAASCHETSQPSEAMHDTGNDRHNVEHAEYWQLVSFEEEKHGGNTKEQ